MKFRFRLIPRFFILFGVFAALTLVPQFVAFAAANLSITPITWNVVGLDSNDVTSGPNHFPVGARVCNNGDAIATNVKSSFEWTTSDSFINIRTGTSAAYTDDGLDLNPGECFDFYYEVEVERNSSAYEHTREYLIHATADGGLAVSTPDNRELFVEHLISQSRNAVTDVQLDGASIAPGGTMVLNIGETYEIKLVGSTATNGYNQLESFINFPNTIFQILSVESTYSVSDLGSPLDVLYADACGWENDLTDPNYKACVVSNGKAGGSVTVTYQVKILSAGSGASDGLNTLLYDFSGSSFHYNSDYSVAARQLEIVDPSNVTISKNFSPDPTNVGGTSKLTFTLSNPNAITLSGVSFSDTFPTTPGAMVVADPAGASTAGCGTPTFAPVAGASSISFSGGTIAANSTCTVSLNVSVPAIGTYSNTTGTLKYISGGTEFDTGNTASDTLEVNDAPAPPAPVCDLNLAIWSMDPTQGLTSPPAPFFQAGNVSTAAASSGAGITTVIDTTGNPLNSWLGYGWLKTFDTANNEYFQFAVDTSNYTDVMFYFDAQRKSPGPDTAYLYYSSNAAGPYTQIATYNPTTAWLSYSQDFAGLTNTTGNTYFRLYAIGANNEGSGADLSIDNIKLTGCSTPSHVQITKAFSPSSIQVGAVSTLTFSVKNPNSVGVTNVAFTDDLPTGIKVAATPAASTSGCGVPTFAPGADDTSLTFSGGVIAANGTCTVSVNVTATTAGPHTNVSGFVSSTESGTNTDTDGYATANLTALLPPEIAKAFGATPIFEGDTSLLTFTITNPNQDDTLNGIAFTDTYPTGVTNVNPLSPAATNTCGGTLTAVAGGSTISLSGGTLAGGASCTVSVTVTSSTPGTVINTSGNVSSTNGGTGNTAEAELKVKTPQPGISMLKTISDSASGPWTKFVSVDPGDSVYYQFLVENTGDVALSPVVIDDPDLDTTGCTFTDPLPVGTPTTDPTSTCMIGPFTAAEGYNTNTAEADATYNSVVYSSSSSSATYVGALPALTLLKEVSTSGSGPWSSDILGVAPGADVYYRFTITNSGNVPLASVYVTDPDITTTGCSFTAPLAVSDSTSCVVGPETGETTVGKYTNTATAHGTYEYSALTYDSDTSSASYSINSPDLTITKENDTGGSVANGSAFNWTLTISNQGTVAADFTDGQAIMSDTLPVGPTYGTLSTSGISNITNPGFISCGIVTGVLSCSASGGTVTLNPSGTFAVTLSVTTTAEGDLTNTATVDPDTHVIESDETNNSDSDTVTVSAGSASMTVEKSSTTTAISTTGAVPYSYVITNTGNVTLTNVTLTDDNTDNTPVCSPAQSSSLIPNAKMNCTATHTVTQSEIDAGGNLTNTATADSDETDAAEDVLNIPFTQNQAMTLVKSSTTTLVTATGTVPYSYVITNTGNVTLTNVTLTDDNTDDPPVCVPAQGSSVAPGAKMNCTATHTVVQGEIDAGGNLTNTATADSDETASVEDTLNIPINGSESMTVEKSSTTTWVKEAGEVIPYSYVITNTGSSTLTNVTLTDDNTDNTPVCVPAQGSSLAPGATMNCTAEHTVTTGEMSAGGNVTNVATADSDETSAVQDTLNIPIAEVSIGAAKRMVSKTEVSAGTYEIVYQILVRNYGNVSVDDLQITDDLDATFPGTSYSVEKVESTDFSVNFPGYNGGTNTDLLTGTDSLAVDASGTVTLTVQVVPTSPGPFENTAIAEGVALTDVVVSDESSDGSDPDNTQDCPSCVNGNDDPSDNTKPTSVEFGPNLFDPPFGIKVFDDAGLPVLRWTMVWINDSNIVAVDAEVHDPISTGTTFAASGASSGYAVPAGAPAGSTNAGVSCTADPSSSTTVTTLCYYEGPTTPYPLGRIIWEGTLGPDLGATNAANASNEIVIAFNVNVDGGVTSVSNSASADADLNGNGDIDPGETTAASVVSTWTQEEVTELPDTGFAPNVMTTVPQQPENKTYQVMGDVWLEVPALNLRTSIVGVPLANGEWDVTWLGRQAGWLHGTAFPSYAGNSVLTGHVYMANGAPGPFVDLSSLSWDDRIIVHAFGYQYVYEVRQSSTVTPGNLSPLQHEELPWLTLLTCKGFDEASNSYDFRVGVRAVLVEVVEEEYHAIYE